MTTKTRTRTRTQTIRETTEAEYIKLGASIMQDHERLLKVALAAIEHLADADRYNSRAAVLGMRLASWLRHSPTESAEGIRGAATLVFNRLGFSGEDFRVSS